MKIDLQIISYEFEGVFFQVSGVAPIFLSATRDLIDQFV